MPHQTWALRKRYAKAVHGGRCAGRDSQSAQRARHGFVDRLLLKVEIRCEAERLGIVGILVEYQPDQICRREEILLERESMRRRDPAVAIRSDLGGVGRFLAVVEDSRE